MRPGYNAHPDRNLRGSGPRAVVRHTYSSGEMLIEVWQTPAMFKLAGPFDDEAEAGLYAANWNEITAPFRKDKTK